MLETLRRVIAFSGADVTAATGRAEFSQVGTMWRTPGSKPLAFTATQWIAPASAAFSWLARFRMLPGVALHINDAFEDGHGRLTGRLWGWLKLFGQAGPEVDRGQVYRYLAELPWAPAAYTANKALTWDEPQPGHLRAACTVAGRTLRVTYDVDADGRVTGVRAQVRPREIAGGFVETPWVGRFDNWQRFGAVMVPTEAEVAWETPEGPFTYFRCAVTAHTIGSSP